MVTVSLLLNVAVLLPVCTGLVLDLPWVRASYGDFTPAHGILLSIYAAILVCSALLLLRPLPAAVASLLLVQIVYKILTPFTVGSIANPVVISNLLISAVHAVTLALIWQAVAPSALNAGSRD